MDDCNLTCSLCGYKFKDKDKLRYFGSCYSRERYYHYKDNVTDRWYIGTDIKDHADIKKEYGLYVCKKCFKL